MTVSSTRGLTSGLSTSTTGAVTEDQCSKKQHQESVEKDFDTIDTKKMWATMKSITFMTPNRKSLYTTDEN